MPETMIDIFDKSSALGNVFNKAVSSADGVNAVRAGEGAESAAQRNSFLFRRYLDKKRPGMHLVACAPPEKSGKTVVTSGAAGTQKDALTTPLLTGDKLPAAKLQVAKEGLKGVKQQKGKEINSSVINEQILNGIFSVNMPHQLATGVPSNPQTIEGESGLQMGNTITGNVANVASTLFTSTMGIPVGIGDETGNGFSTVDNQTLLATAGKGIPVEGLNLSAAIPTPFVKESVTGTNARPGNTPSLLDNQSLQAAAGNEDLYGEPVEEKGVTVKNLGLGMVKDTGRLQMAGKSGLNNIPLLQLLRNGQLPSSLIEIRGRAFQGSNTGAVMNRMPGFYELPIQNTSQGGEQVFSMQTMLNALRMAEAAGVKVAPDAQGNASVEVSATNALQMTKEPNAVSGFSPEQDGVDAAAFQASNTITGKVANAASTLFTSTMRIPVGIGDETDNGFSMVDNQSLLATAGKGAIVEGLNSLWQSQPHCQSEATMGINARSGNGFSTVDNQPLLVTEGKGATVEGLNLSTSTTFVKEATMEIVTGQGNGPSLVDNQTLPVTAGKEIPVEGLNLSAVIPTPFVKESVTGTNARPGNTPSLLDNQSLQAAAGNEDLSGAPVEEKGVTVKNLGLGMVKDAGRLQMAGKSGTKNIPLLQLLRNGQLPSSLIEIRGRAFQGSNTGAVMNRMPGFL